MKAKLHSCVFFYYPFITPPLLKTKSFTSLNVIPPYYVSFHLLFWLCFHMHSQNSLLSLTASGTHNWLYFFKNFRFLSFKFLRLPLENLFLRFFSSAFSRRNPKLKVQMNKGFVNSLQFYGSPEDSKANHKYHYLLEDYQDLQKVRFFFLVDILMVFVLCRGFAIKFYAFF